jgi:DNA-binding PadR family transcriptional regulator
VARKTSKPVAYPLLRELEDRGLIEGRWEHPDP